MTKELEALRDLASRDFTWEHGTECVKVIETALKDYEELKKLKLLPYPKVNDEEYRRNVIKKLQALEIIKEKQVNVYNLITYHFETEDTYEEYVENFNWCVGLGKELLTKKEYDLLKEVLL